MKKPKRNARKRYSYQWSEDRINWTTFAESEHNIQIRVIKKNRQMKKLIKYIKSLHFHKWEDTGAWIYWKKQVCTKCAKLRTVWRLN